MTNMETGMPEYIKIDSVFEQMDVLRASGSMPFVSEPVLIHGKGIWTVAFPTAFRSDLPKASTVIN